MRACVRCTVIGRGEGIGTVNVSETNTTELATLMVGRSISFKTEKTPSNPKDTVLNINNLVVKDSRKLDAVKGLDLEVKAGEIVGIAGIDGNGQTELIEAVTGLTKSESGSIKLRDKEIMNLSPRKVTESGLAHIRSEERREGN